MRPAFLLSWMQSPAARSTILRRGTVMAAPDGGEVDVDVAGRVYTLPYIGDPTLYGQVWVLCCGRTWLVLSPECAGDGVVEEDGKYRFYIQPSPFLGASDGSELAQYFYGLYFARDYWGAECENLPYYNWYRGDIGTALDRDSGEISGFSSKFGDMFAYFTVPNPSPPPGADRVGVRHVGRRGDCGYVFASSLQARLIDIDGVRVSAGGRWDYDAAFGTVGAGTSSATTTATTTSTSLSAADLYEWLGQRHPYTGTPVGSFSSSAPASSDSLRRYHYEFQIYLEWDSPPC